MHTNTSADEDTNVFMLRSEAARKYSLRERRVNGSKFKVGLVYIATFRSVRWKILSQTHTPPKTNQQRKRCKTLHLIYNEVNGICPLLLVPLHREQWRGPTPGGQCYPFCRTTFIKTHKAAARSHCPERRPTPL